MLQPSSFTSFIERIRAGDELAARELVRDFEGVIRREVRLRVDDLRLLRAFDSMDISQSVLTSFFKRAETGQFEIETPEKLASLLIGMTRNKVAHQVRRARAGRRDFRMTVSTRIDEISVASSTQGPCEIASDVDLIDAIKHRLDDEERQIVDLRAEGWQWPEIAERLGGTPQARRMQLTRAVHRVAKALNLEDYRCR